MGGEVWVSTPWQSGGMTTGMISGVWIRDDQEVDWTWSHGLDGTSYVSGYTVKERLPKLETFKTQEDNP